MPSMHEILESPAQSKETENVLKEYEMKIPQDCAERLTALKF